MTTELTMPRPVHSPLNEALWFMMVFMMTVLTNAGLSIQWSVDLDNPLRCLNSEHWSSYSGTTPSACQDSRIYGWQCQCMLLWRSILSIEQIAGHKQRQQKCPPTGKDQFMIDLPTSTHVYPNHAGGFAHFLAGSGHTSSDFWHPNQRNRQLCWLVQFAP